MKHQTSKALYEYWDSLRGRRTSALRTEIDPARIKDHLPHLLTLKQVNDETYEFLLAGTGLFEIFGRELTRTDMTQLFTGKDRESMLSLLYSVCEDQTASVVGFTAKTADGREAKMELILLPISHRSQKTRIFGALSIFEKPHWMGMFPVVSLEVNSLRVIWPSKGTHFVNRVADRPLETNPASYMPLDTSHIGKEIPIPGQTPVRRHGHLRVIEGGISS